MCGKDASRAEAVCPVHRIPAADVEDIVFVQIAPVLRSPEIVANAATSAGLAPHEALALLDGEFQADLSPGERNRLLSFLLQRAVIFKDRIELEFKTSGIQKSWRSHSTSSV